MFSEEDQVMQETKVQRECVDSRGLEVMQDSQDPEACRETKENVAYLAYKDDQYALLFLTYPSSLIIVQPTNERATGSRFEV